MKHHTLRIAPFALALLLCGPVAHAKGWKSFTKSVSNTATSATNTVTNTATNTASTTNSIVNMSTSFTANTVANAGSIAVSPRTGMWTQDQHNFAIGHARGMYYPGLQTTVNGYNSTVSAVEAANRAALELLFREAGRLALARDIGNLRTIANRAQNLSFSGKVALARVQDAIINKRADEQGRTDMITIARELGLFADAASKVFPNNMQRSSFGIAVGAAAAYIGGVDESYSMVLQTFLEDGKYKVGLASSVGASVGVQLGAGVSVGLFWSPGGIADTSGGSVGFGVEAAVGPGFGTGLSWSVQAGMTGAQNAIPAYSMAFVSGAALGGAFNGGYTQVYWVF